MTPTPQPSRAEAQAQGEAEPPNEEDQDQRWLRRLLLLLLILMGSFCCMLLAAQIALLGLDGDPLERDVRSVVEVDYGAGERRAAPLDPEVIEDIKEELEATPPTPDTSVVTIVPVVEIPTIEPTPIAQITPTPSATPTDIPTPTPTLEIPTETPTSSPEPATETPSPTPEIPTPTPTPSSTPEIPTLTPTPSSTPQTPTATPSPTLPPPIPTNTDTPIPTFTDTPTPTPTDTATPTPTPTLLPPVVLGMTPAATVQGSAVDPPFGVVVVGQNFVNPVSTWLGDVAQNIVISVSNVTATVITGTLSPDIQPGVYALTVQNPDLQSDTLAGAFTVYPRTGITKTLDSATAFVATFGPGAAITEGDDDYVQIIFFDAPAGPNDTLYIRIFDADTGNSLDEVGLDGLFNTTMTYTVRGGLGAYNNADAQSDHPGALGINSGTLINQQVIGINGALDNNWLTLPISRTQGELVGSRRVFKLVVQGASGDDANWYEAVLSADPNSNVAVPDARTFAFSWCIALPAPGDQVLIYPFVPSSASDFTQINFDFDISPGSIISLTTPLRNLPVLGLSGNGLSASDLYPTFSDERNATWTARYVTGSIPNTANDFVAWFLGNSTTSLAIFTRPSLSAPP